MWEEIPSPPLHPPVLSVKAAGGGGAGSGPLSRQPGLTQTLHRLGLQTMGQCQRSWEPSASQAPRWPR